MSELMKLLDPKRKLHSRTLEETEVVALPPVSLAVVDTQRLKETVSTVLAEYNVSVSQVLNEIERLQGAETVKVKESVDGLVSSYGKIELLLNQVSTLLTKKDKNAEQEQAALTNINRVLNKY